MRSYTCQMFTHTFLADVLRSFAVGRLCTSSLFHDIRLETTISPIRSWVSQFPPWAVYYYHTCLPRLPAFILGTLECVDKSTYGCLMARNTIMSRITMMSSLQQNTATPERQEVWRKVLRAVHQREWTLVMLFRSRLVVHRG